MHDWGGKDKGRAGQGQTPFQIAAEWVICGILGLALVLLYRGRKAFPGPVALILAGHLGKIVSFVLVYRSVVVVGIEDPYNMVFGELHRKVDEVTRLNGELQEANRTKDRFFSIIAHDLRGPLATLTGILDLLSGDWAGWSEGERKSMVGQLGASRRRVSGLLENLLLWARNQTGTLEVHPEPVSAVDLVAGVLDLLRDGALAKEIELVQEPGPVPLLHTDRNMLETIVRNLAGNALKFTPRGGRVTVETAWSGGLFRVTVSDNGTGIPAQELPRLFHPDGHVKHPGTEQEQGTGLGLVLPDLAPEALRP